MFNAVASLFKGQSITTSSATNEAFSVDKSVSSAPLNVKHDSDFIDPLGNTISQKQMSESLQMLDSGVIRHIMNRTLRSREAQMIFRFREEAKAQQNSVVLIPLRCEVGDRYTADAILDTDVSHSQVVDSLALMGAKFYDKEKI